MLTRWCGFAPSQAPSSAVSASGSVMFKATASWFNCRAFNHGASERIRRVERIETFTPPVIQQPTTRSEEHTSELQSLMRISYAVFCLKKKKYETQETIAKLAQT